ncbi:MAG: serine/threonine-protein phosphatase [Leptospirales bacterium]|nr:serine/threonine-protein phosphatase [Leptospirales bacterium]
MADPEIRQALFEFLKDEIVYLLQKNLTHDYQLPGLPSSVETRRYNIHLMKSLRVYSFHAPGKDFTRAGMVGRWYELLGRRKGLSSANAVAYFTILRQRLHALGNSVPYTFADLTRLVAEVVSDEAGSLTFEDVYRAEILFCREFRSHLHEVFPGIASHRESAESLLEDLSHDFVVTFQSAVEKTLRDRITDRERIHSEVLVQKQALDDEMRQAARLHNKSIQRELPNEDARISFHAWYEPSSIVGGDFYRIIRTSPDTYGLFLADIAGHGVSAAMYLLSVKTCFDKHQRFLDRPGEMIQLMNNELYGNLADNFFTVMCAHVDLGRNRIDYCNAGHPKAFLVLRSNPDAVRVRFLRPNSKVVGIFSDAEYRTDSLPIEGPARLALYTDGITETVNESGDMLDERGLLDLFEGTTDQAGDSTIAHVRTALASFAKKQKAEDDRTLILADIQG